MIEKWEDIVNQLNLDLYRENVYYIKANQIKQITNRTQTYGKNGYIGKRPFFTA